MTFSNKLKADYIEMINGELDRIPVAHIEEFNLIAQELQNIINFHLIGAIKGFFFPKPKTTLSNAIEEQLDYIRYCYNVPKDFVTYAKDYPEYQQIIKERISAKIIEFQKLTEKEKNDYILFQREKHSKTELTN